MPWKGDWLIGQNTFRRLLRTHFSPHGHSLPELMPVAASIHGMVGFNDTTEAKLLEFTERVAKADLRLTQSGWMRAGIEADFRRGRAIQTRTRNASRRD